MTPPLCRHCGRKPANRPLGLCWSCYYTPYVRALYTSESKYAPAHNDFNGGYQQPAAATEIPPGPLKVGVLAERVWQRVALWHPDDVPGHPPPSKHNGRK